MRCHFGRAPPLLAPINNGVITTPKERTKKENKGELTKLSTAVAVINKNLGKKCTRWLNWQLATW